MLKIIDKLYNTSHLTTEELKKLLTEINEEELKYLLELSSKQREQYYGKKVYTRGLIEFTNYCKNDCYYCGIRCSNKKVVRYRLNEEDILRCCQVGYQLEFRTFVLQGGEDPYYTDDMMVNIISKIRNKYADCAITLSFGEKSYESYKRYYEAGANRYLLRHETANAEHYSKLHPKNMTLKTRKQCLQDLKAIGYQVGTGFLVGSPFQTIDNIVEDLLYIKELQPEMIGIGPFIPASNTPFENQESGTVKFTTLLIAIIRLLLPKALIPATTALGTIDPQGREMGIQAGANVVMPNLSPLINRKKYSLYDNKISTGEEAAESKILLKERIEKAGFEISYERGDYIGI